MMLGYKEKTLIGIAVLLVALTILVPFASPEIDGLEKVADEELEEGNTWSDAEKLGEDVADLAPFPDYVAFFGEDDDLAAITSGIIGILLILGVFAAMILIIRYRNQKREQTQGED
ncbi:MAG: PDGLE domain-containing protein [Candidatus Thorarchaeota archaeon]